MNSQKITFLNSNGQELSAKIDAPVAGKPKAYALFAHCFTCSKNLKAVDNISKSLTQQNIGVLRFDFTGLGQSEGVFAETNFSSNLSDLESAYHFLKESYEAPQLLIGHSLGGAAVLHASSRMPAVKAVATIAAPANPTHVKKLFNSHEDEIRQKGQAEVSIGGRPFQIKEQLLNDLEQKDSHEVIEKLGKALLILHSPQDSVVGIENATDIYLSASHPKSFISLDGSDHLLSKEEDSLYAGHVIAPWASRYLESSETNNIAPEGEVWTKIGENGFLTEVIAGEHQLIADEPKGSGGSDLGPSPYGFLLTALGTCTAMTLRMYADFKKIKLKSVKVKLTHDKIHHDDGEQSESSKGKIDQIKRLIHIEGDLSAEQRKRLIEIADRCPVHKTIEGKPQIITEEIEDF